MVPFFSSVIELSCSIVLIVILSSVYNGHLPTGNIDKVTDRFFLSVEHVNLLRKLDMDAAFGVSHAWPRADKQFKVIYGPKGCGISTFLTRIYEDERYNPYTLVVNEFRTSTVPDLLSNLRNKATSHHWFSPPNMEKKWSELKTEEEVGNEIKFYANEFYRVNNKTIVILIDLSDLSDHSHSGLLYRTLLRYARIWTKDCVPIRLIFGTHSYEMVTQFRPLKPHVEILDFPDVANTATGVEHMRYIIGYDLSLLENRMQQKEEEEEVTIMSAITKLHTHNQWLSETSLLSHVYKNMFTNVTGGNLDRLKRLYMLFMKSNTPQEVVKRWQDHRTAVFDQVRDDFDVVLQGVEWDLIRKLCVFVVEQQKKIAHKDPSSTNTNPPVRVPEYLHHHLNDIKVFERHVSRISKYPFYHTPVLFINSLYEINFMTPAHKYYFVSNKLAEKVRV